MYLYSFRLLSPAYEAAQDVIARWLAAAHVQAQSHVSPLDGEQWEQLREELYESLLKVSGWPDRIEKRGSFLEDFTHYDWSAMEVYNLDESSRGRGIGDRMEVFARTCDAAFDSLFGNEESAPDNLIHVTCTGYASPSAAQKIVAKRGWESKTTVTHAYHMGCYAAIPALRIGSGFLADGASRTDVVHTELCTLHFEPLRHDAEQLVVQSLFSDGIARYSLDSQPPAGRALEVLAIKEAMLADTGPNMTWILDDYGMGMTLARDVPRHIEGTVKAFVSDLVSKSSLRPVEKWISASQYAVHPGGPLIIDVVAEQLRLESSQVRHSNHVLRKRGNMSSATLPHIWGSMLDDPDLDPDLPVISLAFGPGLTLAGAIMRVSRRP